MNLWQIKIKATQVVDKLAKTYPLIILVQCETFKEAKESAIEKTEEILKEVEGKIITKITGHNKIGYNALVVKQKEE